MSARERRLIVVTFHYPPDGAVGGLRWAGLTRYLAERGWRIWVVTAAPASSEKVGGVEVITVPRGRTLNDAYRGLRQRAQPAAAAVTLPAAVTPAVGSNPSLLRRALEYLRLEAGQLLAAPDEARGWVLRAARQARRLVREVQPTALVTSGPPHSPHVAGWLATRGLGVRWFADFRDPWAGPVSEAWLDMPQYRSPFSRWLRRRLERHVIRHAHALVCNTRETGAFFSQRYPGVAPIWIPNGVDGATLPSPPAARHPALGVAYIGTLYGGRDLTPVLEGMARFLRDGGDAYPGTALRVAGSVDDSDLARLRNAAAQRGMADRLQYVGVLPRAAALDTVARSHLALVLAQKQDLQVPAKLYEMVGLGIPTLVLGNPEGATAAEARRLGAFAVAPDDVPGIVRVMRTAAEGSGRRAAIPSMLDYRELAAMTEQVLMGEGDSRSLLGLLG